MRRLLFLLITVCAAMAVQAEPQAAVRQWTCHVDVGPAREYRVTTHTEVVIYREAKRFLANYYDMLDKDEKVSRFSCVVKALNGGFSRKYKASDLIYSEYSESMAADVRTVVLDIDLPTYPVVVTTDVETVHGGNTLSFPAFAPLPSYDTRLDEARYEIDFPPEMRIRYTPSGLSLKPTVTTTPKGKTRWTFAMGQLPPVGREPYTRPLSQRLPKVYLMPEQITYYGTQASMASWADLGRWVGGLCSGQDVLPEAARAKVRQLIEGCTSDWQRLERLYQFLRQSTRYVSIQLGIGGYRPLPAEYVWRTGFGDCKALTNYMKALLAEAGISSTYTLVSTEYDRLAEYPNFYQLDHVVLQVPTQRGVICIECTNPEIPLGYIHDGIAGHDAIAITPQGGSLVTLPDYADSLCLRTVRAQTQLQADGTGTVRISDRRQSHRYAEQYGWKELDAKERCARAAQGYRLPQGTISRADISTGCQWIGDSIAVPYTLAEVEAQQVKVGTSTGSRIFVGINPLHANYTATHLAKDRKADVYVEQGYKNVEEIELTLPEGCVVEAAPQPIRVANEAGSFVSVTQVKGRTVLTTSTLTLRRGTYPAAKAALIDALDRAAGQAYAAQMVLRRSAAQ